MKPLGLAPDDERLVQVFRALGNPMRFRILQVLAAQRACICGDLVDLLPLAQSTVSEHLKVLKAADLIQGTISGPATCYCINPATAAWLREQIARVFPAPADPLPSMVAVGSERSVPMASASRINPEDIKLAVSSRYAARAGQQLTTLQTLPLVADACCPTADAACCAPATDAACATGACATEYSAEDLASLPVSVTGVSLGCGNPVGLAEVRAGETVLDLGSGGGIDCFLAARRVGPQGKVIGVDMTPEMVRLARTNAREVGADNVEFRLGEIEHLPLDPHSVDLVISNCVVNLVPDKEAVFREVARVLRPGGRLVISDTVASQPVPEELRAQIELWSRCASGSLDRETYFATLREAGFDRIEVLDEHNVDWGNLTDGLTVLSMTVRAYTSA